jgi:hypothetical protein
MTVQAQSNALVLLLPSKAPRPLELVAREKDSQRLTPQQLVAMALEHPGIPKAAA